MELKSKVREEILGKIEKASSDEYETEWDNAGRIGTQKKKSKIKKGKKSKSSGNQFEAKVRHDLEEKGLIVDKWTNNLDLESQKIIPAKRKFNPFSKVMTIGTGFPDFIAFQLMKDDFYRIIGVEVKSNGNLSRIEKEKCAIYLKNRVFAEILIAKKVKKKNRINIQYTNVLEILKRMRNV